MGAAVDRVFDTARGGEDDPLEVLPDRGFSAQIAVLVRQRPLDREIATGDRRDPSPRSNRGVFDPAVGGRVLSTAQLWMHPCLDANGVVARRLAFSRVFPGGCGLFFEFALGALDSIFPKPSTAWDNRYECQSNRDRDHSPENPSLTAAAAWHGGGG